MRIHGTDGKFPSIDELLFLVAGAGNRKSPSDVIQTTLEANMQTRQRIAILVDQQRAFILNFPPNFIEALALLNATLTSVKSELQNQLRLLQYVHQNALLEPFPLHQVRFFSPLGNISPF